MDLATWIETLDDDAREYFEERAGIAEFDAGLPRAEAEIAARELTEAYLQRRKNQK
jgi:hypothetical protein